MMKPIRVLVADDHPIVREGIARILEFQTDMSLAGYAADGVEAVSQADALKPDVIIMDLRMPHKDGVTAIREIIEKDPDARILALSGYGEDEDVFAAVQAGALGFWPKSADADQMLQAFRTVSQGASVLHPCVAAKLRQQMGRRDSPPTTESLTPRELDVLRLLAQGLANKEIARQLSLSNYTVQTHVRNIFGKVQVSSRTLAALYARELKII